MERGHFFHEADVDFPIDHLAGNLLEPASVDPDLDVWESAHVGPQCRRQAGRLPRLRAPRSRGFRPSVIRARTPPASLHCAAPRSVVRRRRALCRLRSTTPREHHAQRAECRPPVRVASRFGRPQAGFGQTRSAARVNVRSSTTARKCSSCRRSMVRNKRRRVYSLRPKFSGCGHYFFELANLTRSAVRSPGRFSDSPGAGAQGMDAVHEWEEKRDERRTALRLAHVVAPVARSDARRSNRHEAVLMYGSGGAGAVGARRRPGATRLDRRNGQGQQRRASCRASRLRRGVLRRSVCRAR